MLHSRSFHTVISVSLKFSYDYLKIILRISKNRAPVAMHYTGYYRFSSLL